MPAVAAMSVRMRQRVPAGVEQASTITAFRVEQCSARNGHRSGVRH
jgi:hypothetical protein